MTTLKIKSKNGTYAVIEGKQLLLVAHEEEGADRFFSDSPEWLYELYKILKRCDERGCFNAFLVKEVREEEEFV